MNNALKYAIGIGLIAFIFVAGIFFINSRNHSTKQNDQSANAIASGSMGGGGGGSGHHGGGHHGGGHHGGGHHGGHDGGHHGGWSGGWGSGWGSGWSGGYIPSGGYSTPQPQSTPNYTYTTIIDTFEPPVDVDEPEGEGDGPGEEEQPEEEPPVIIIEDGADVPFGPEGEGPGEADGVGGGDDGDLADDAIDAIIDALLAGLGISIDGVDIIIIDGGGYINWCDTCGWGGYYGDATLLTYPIEPGIITQHIVMKAPPKSLTGCYKTTWGIMRLHVKDDKVTGTFKRKGKASGQIVGKLKDNLLIGMWIKPGKDKKDKKAVKTGPFQFAFTEDWMKFTGVWGKKGEVPLKKDWNGKRIKCPPKEPEPKEKPKK